MFQHGMTRDRPKFETVSLFCVYGGALSSYPKSGFESLLTKEKKEKERDMKKTTTEKR
jgi:hypothetical protein